MARKRPQKQQRRPRNHPEWVWDYEKSDAWKNRKSRYYRRHDRRCAACNKRGWDIALHHKRYRGKVIGTVIDLRNKKYWGKEPDWWLTPLCFRCHDNVHAIDNGGKYRTLEEATNAYIEQTQRRRARHRRYARLPLIGWLFR